MSTLKSETDNNQGVNDASDVLDRLKYALATDTDAALADEMGVTRASVSKWRSRGSVPYALIIEKFKSKGPSQLLYVLTGEQFAFEGDVVFRNFDISVVREVIISMIKIGMLEFGSALEFKDREEILKMVTALIVGAHTSVAQRVRVLMNEQELLEHSAVNRALKEYRDGEL